MNRVCMTFLLATLAASPLAAQEARLSGTVAEVFGTQIVLATPEGRLLVTLPDGSADPALGTQLTVTGTRSGAVFAASAVTASAAPAADPAVTPTLDAAEALLPAELRGLGLTEIRSRPDDDGETYLYARLPQGVWIRAEAQGARLTDVQADGTGLPQPLVDALLPAAARAEPRLSEIARVTGIELDRDEISVQGTAADGMRIEIDLSPDGKLREFDRERDSRRSMTEAAARERLAELGYTSIGFVERGGRHVTAIAANPFGDTVELRLDDQGRVERERLWQD